MKRVNAMIKQLNDDMIVSARLEDLQKTNAENTATNEGHETNVESVKETKKDKKIDDVVTKKEGLEQKDIIHDKYTIGQKIKVNIKDEKGKGKWYKGVIKRKRKKKHLIEWDNDDPSEWLNLEEENVKNI